MLTTNIYSSRKGFTLLEILIVITIMGFLAAMVIPVGGAILHRERVEHTWERLELVRTAILGTRDAFDARGFRVIGGYVGDMQALPGLYKSKWNAAAGRWDWVDTEITLATGQPLALWDNRTITTTGVTLSWANWRGPYITFPTDLSPRDAEGFYETTHDGTNSLDEFHMRQTAGKLSDAWGRALLFWKQGAGNDATLWIISEGPDSESDWSGGIYDPTKTANQDNFVVKITPHEWFDPNRPAEVLETQRRLERIMDALLGPPGAFDPSGRRIIGGYLGDMGAWPELHAWVDPPGEWQVATGVVMQPRALWIDPGGPIADGFGWRGPYLPKPWGEGKDEVLRDAWDEPLRFERETAGADETLTIASAGPDRNIGTAGDNIERTITKGHWTATMAVSGKVVRKGVSGDLSVTIRLHHRPGVSIATGVAIASGYTVMSFSLPETGTDTIHAGPRLVIATGVGVVVVTDSTTVFIGAGGTQSPVENHLILEVE